MQHFFSLIQIALGNKEFLSHIPTSDEWEEAYDLARKQAVAGVAFYGIIKYVDFQHNKCRMQKLQFDGVNAGCRNLEPESSDDEEEFDESWLEAVNLPEELYYTWMQQAMDIQKRNQLMDERCVELQKMLSDAGFRNCILKGQGVARLYKSHANDNPNEKEDLGLGILNIELASLRQSGDIDIWVDAPRDKIISYVKSKCIEKVDISGKHIAFPFFKDIIVEIHYNLIVINNPKYKIRLNNFYQKEKSCQMSNSVVWGDHLMTIPTKNFNIIYILNHIYNHCLFEGVGLRQIMDYYFVLKQGFSEEEKGKIISQLKHLGLYKFACAISFVMKEAFGYSDCFIPSNKKYGNIVLRAVMDEGNFGKYDINRDKGKWKYPLYRFVYHIKRQIKFIPIAPLNILWSPIARCKEFLWRFGNGYF